MPRERLSIRGRVQGVGFRPFVYRLALSLGLVGRVGNDGTGVFVEVEGDADTLATFRRRLREEAPPLARIADLGAATIPETGEESFAIAASRPDRPAVSLSATPDIATCAACLAELGDPGDRRHRYPFINCTDCGPRYSLIRSLPYDRERTSMACFAMCPACAAEYADPADRRYHAQPDACPVCGPRAWLADAGGVELPADDPVAAARERLLTGDIVAVKGIGGFHLACRADDEKAVARLRERKDRETKPLAVMVADLERARRLARIDGASERFLAGAERAIVLCPPRPGHDLAPAVAPGSRHLGLLLPYTPLHHLLIDGQDPPLVMTSGNPGGEPLCIGNREARDRLDGIADAFLFHDRDIVRPVDDSVVMADPGRDAVIPVRRARGFVPDPVFLPRAAPEPVLALGGDLKSAVCLLRDDRAVVSEHLGDLEHPAALRHFLGAVGRLEELLDCRPRILAHDAHPGYQSTREARRLDRVRTVAVQHHHAHAVACLADNGLVGPAVCIAADGTGYGSDGSVWGGEVLVADERDFIRFSHLRGFALPGGDRAARETWRPALGLLHSWRLGDPGRALPAGAVDGEVLDATVRVLENGRGIPTSSLGRLFDAVACLLDLRHRNRFEGEAPIALEAAAAGTDLPADLPPAPVADGIVDPAPLMAALVAARDRNAGTGALALAFHMRIADALSAAARDAAAAHRLERVCCSGGCFLNTILRARVAERLAEAGLDVLFHRQLPTGDGCLSLGQAVIAAARLAS